MLSETGKSTSSEAAPQRSSSITEGFPTSSVHRTGRQRAVSASDIDGLLFNPGSVERNVWSRDELGQDLPHVASNKSSNQQRPILSLTPPALSENGSRLSSRRGSVSNTSDGHLAPPSVSSTVILPSPQPTSPAHITASPMALSPQNPEQSQFEFPSLPSAHRPPEIVINQDSTTPQAYRDDPNDETQYLLDRKSVV